MIKLSMHTDNWRTLSGSFEQAVASAVEHKLEYIEFGTVDGQEFIQGLGYDPALPLDTDEMWLNRYLGERGLKISQIDAGYPLTGPKGAVYGVPYVWKAIRMAHLTGCPYVDSTDGAAKPAGFSDEEVIAQWRFCIRLALERAESFKVGINIETHGPYTNNPELMLKLMREFDSEYLGINLDTGNTFISGNDPVELCKAFRPWLKYVHCKDVSHSLAASMRGEETGIAVSEVSIGEGANAANIKGCIDFLKESSWDGVFCVETAGTPENIKKSVDWLRSVI